MARFFAQICTFVFLIVTVGGLLLGNATAVSSGHAGGNLGSITLHMTWVRDGVDAVLLAAFVYTGFFASRRNGRLVMAVAGTVLLALGVIGFVTGDNDQATGGWAGMHFPAVINIFDTTAGILAILAALGTIEDDAPHEQESIIRPGTTIGKAK